MTDYSTADLSNLWIQAGGPSSVAGLMGAIAFAESSGNPDAINSSSGACGLWQIHPAENGCTDPFTNAQMAVRKYNSQGLNAWEAYTNGAYKQYYNGDVSLLSSSGGSSDTNCLTYNSFGICLDGVVGLGAIVVGLTLMALAVVLAVLHDPTVKKGLETAVVVVPK